MAFESVAIPREKRVLAAPPARDERAARDNHADDGDDQRHDGQHSATAAFALSTRKTLGAKPKPR